MKNWSLIKIYEAENKKNDEKTDEGKAEAGGLCNLIKRN